MRRFGRILTGLNKEYTKRILWVLFILSPLISVLLIGYVSGTSVFRLDALHTIWNDEIGYFRAVKIIRMQGLPTGIQSYNEVASDIPAYGAYTIVTYLPYVFISFVTGIFSDNFIYYGNVLLILIANVVFVILLKPDAKKTCWLFVFSVFSLIYERYVWSGMSEASHCAFMIILLALFCRLFDERKCKRVNVILVFAVSLILFFGMIRAFHFIWILVPIVYIIKSERKRQVKFFGVVVVIILVFACYYIFRFLSVHWAAPYFSGSRTTANLNTYLNMLRNGQIRSLCNVFATINTDSIKSVVKIMRAGSAAGYVIVIFMFQEAILLGWAIYAGMTHRKKRAFLCGITCFASLTVYESIIMLYSVNMCHRMLLPYMVFSAYLICMTGNNWIKMGRQVTELIVIAASVSLMTSFYALPQKNDTVDVVELRQSLESVFVMDKENCWGNTVAKNVEDSNLYTVACLPVYISTSSCTNEYLEEVIEDDTIKSRYIMLTDDFYLNEICSEKYEIIWQGYGHTIYAAW